MYTSDSDGVAAIDIDMTDFSMTETRPVAFRTVVVHATDTAARIGCGVIDNGASSASYDSTTPPPSPAPTASPSASSGGEKSKPSGLADGDMYLLITFGSLFAIVGVSAVILAKCGCAKVQVSKKEEAGSNVELPAGSTEAANPLA